MKHTPGPWEYRTVDESIGGIDDSEGNPIGQSFQLNGDTKGGTRIANAKLMASAPDLLAALYGCYIVMLSNGLDECDEHDAAAAAIAKATGAA